MPHLAKLVSLPPELLDLIAFSIDSRADLTALALTSRACRDVCIPRHLEYRVILCPIWSPVWAHLNERPDLARNVREVYIIRNPTEQFPAIWPYRSRPRMPSAVLNRQSPSLSFHDVLSDISLAVQNMKSIRVFHMSPSALVSHSDRTVTENIWITLQSHPTLRGLGFRLPDIVAKSIYNRFFDGLGYPLWSISNLTSISLENLPTLRRMRHEFMQTFMNNSPNLVNLSMTFAAAVPDDFLLPEGRWPCLRRLALRFQQGPQTTRNSSESLSLFLENHSTLEDIEWRGIFPRKLSSGSLPYLRRLYASDLHDGALSILSTPLDKSRVIECLGRIRLTADYYEVFDTLDHRRLRRVELQFFKSLDDLFNLAKIFPMLTWLRIPSVDYLHDYRRVTESPVVLGEWVRVLHNFPELEVFHGVSFFTDPSTFSSERPDDNDERARVLADSFPKLRQLEHWENDSNKIIELVRRSKEVKFKEVELNTPAAYYKWRNMLL